MKKLVTIIGAAIALSSNAQTVCDMADEGGTVTLTAPPGAVITSIDFASYGTPDGSCGSFTLGTCDEPDSKSIVEAIFLGKNSGTIGADNGTFGDPCGGTYKRLYVQASYSSVLPVTLISFSAHKIEKDKIFLSWMNASEVGAEEFRVERSIDGIQFTNAGTVKSTGSGSSYHFTDVINASVPAYYYRLKMVDRDGKFKYSSIIRVISSNMTVKLSMFPNPAGSYITVVSNKSQEAVITNSSGQVIQKINLVPGDQLLNIEKLSPGLYFMRTGETATKFFKVGE